MRYEQAGVSLHRAEASVDRLRQYVESTFNAHVVGGFGHFAGLFVLDPGDPAAQILVASMDGVGTKVLLAREAGRNATVAGDVVRHGANDCLAAGGRPLFFLDYVAWAKIEPDIMEEIAAGMAEACRAENCVLLGGETAEMPDVYHPGDYDLVGCMIGAVPRSQMVDGSRIQPGDQLVALGSTGLHTNGYSLARKVIQQAGLGLHDLLARCGQSVQDALLAPHRSYTAAVLPLVERGAVTGMAHITGGGIAGNLIRVLPDGCQAVIDSDSWSPPGVFSDLRQLGEISVEEMRSTFNLGVGFVLVIRPGQLEGVLSELKGAGENVWRLGEIRGGTHSVKWSG